MGNAEETPLRPPLVRGEAELLLPYQKRHVGNRARFTCLVWSRQVGKSHASSLRRIIRGVARRRNQVFLSAGERQSRELMAKARTHIEAMKLAFAYDEKDVTFDDVTYKQLEISLPGAGIRIIGLPANPSTARGFTGDVLLDEFAMHKHDREIWASVFPTVLRGAGELDVCSTPAGRQNMFYRMQSNEAFDHSTVTIDDAIADGLDVDREELYRAMGDDELFRQEFLCEFVDEATAFLTYEQICECEDEKLPLDVDLEALREEPGDVVGGMDIGRKHDLTVIWLFDLAGSTMISRGLIELRSMPFREQFEILRSVLDCGCIRRFCIDASGLGMQLAEEAVERYGEHKVEAVPFTVKVKEEISTQLRSKFLDRNIRIPTDERIRNDLHSVRKTVTAAGNVRLEAPREDGSHADRFHAAALAAHAAHDPGGVAAAIVGPALASREWREF